MKKLLIILAALTATFAVVKPAAAETGQNNIGPSVIFGNNGGSAFGVNARFKVNDNFSIRPNIYFPSGGTTFGAAATYDFNLSDTNKDLTPFAGVGVVFASADNNGNNGSTGYVTAGADYNVTDNVVVKGTVNIPFDSTDYSTTFGLGAGLRF